VTCPQCAFEILPRWRLRQSRGVRLVPPRGKDP
jgi:hypothetical protein